MESHSDISPSAITASVAQVHNSSFGTLAILIILIYDWLLCLSDEVEFVWHVKWSTGRCLYLFARYMSFVSATPPIVIYFVAHLNLEQYAGFVTANIWLALTIMFITELIPIWRTYGLWNQHKPILCFLLFLWAGWVACIIYGLVRMTKTVYFVFSHPEHLPQSRLFSWINASAWMIAPLAFVETGIVVLTAMKCMHHVRSNPNSLMTILYRDSLLTFAFLLASTIVTTVVIFTAPLMYFEISSAVLRGMHAVLYCRVILHLRATAQRDSAIPSRVSDARFWEFSGVPQAICALDDVQQDSSMSTAPVNHADLVDTVISNV